MYSQWKIEHTTETDYFLKIHENNLHNEEMQWEVWRLSQYLFSYEYFYSVALWNVSHPPVSLSTTHIQALDIQCTLWSPKYTPNDILDISKNYHLLLRYLYLPYTLHWYFFLVMQSSRILEGFLRSSFKSSAFLSSLSLSNMALAWNCCQLTFQFF